MPRGPYAQGETPDGSTIKVSPVLLVSYRTSKGRYKFDSIACKFLNLERKV